MNKILGLMRMLGNAQTMISAINRLDTVNNDNVYVDTPDVKVTKTTDNP